jgi:hypothetical protein
MSDTVRMRHPDLPDDQTIRVAPSAVPHHRSAGWVVVDTPEPAPADDLEADTAPLNPLPARKRRRTPEGE